MQIRRSWLAGMCAATLIGLTVPLGASAEVGVYFNIAPPPPRHEAIPPPRHGYVWSSGYWNAKGKKHVWQGGHWERNRTGYNLAQPTWTQRDDRWQLERGHWNKGEGPGH